MGPRPLLTAALALAACVAPRPRALTARDYPGALVPVADIAPDFIARQRVVATASGRPHGFDAALQRRGDALTLVGLTPFGARAFVIEQRGQSVAFTPHLTRSLPFPPRFILLDVHRALFMGLPAPHPADGEQRGARDGEEITERYAGGRLTERRFRRLDGHPAGEVVVRYDGGMEPPRPPRALTLRNGWLGYELRVETLSWQAL